MSCWCASRSGMSLWSWSQLTSCMMVPKFILNQQNPVVVPSVAPLALVAVGELVGPNRQILVTKSPQKPRFLQQAVRIQFFLKSPMLLWLDMISWHYAQQRLKK